MGYENYTDRQLREKLNYHNERIIRMAEEIEGFQGEFEELERSIEMRNLFIVAHEGQKAAIRDESRRRRARLADEVEYCDCGDTMAHDSELRVIGIAPPPWGDVNPLIDTLEERVE